MKKIEIVKILRWIFQIIQQCIQMCNDWNEKYLKNCSDSLF